MMWLLISFLVQQQSLMQLFSRTQKMVVIENLFLFSCQRKPRKVEKLLELALGISVKWEKSVYVEQEK